MEMVNFAKNLGVVMATATTFAYITGYLAMRARAFALGTDPAFSLLDESYVFAGFRFLFITLIIILLLSPVIVLVRSGMSWLFAHIPDSIQRTGQWALLIILAIATLYTTVKIMSVNGVLLMQKTGESGSSLREAIMGGSLATVLMFGVILVTILSVFWFKMRLSEASDGLAWVLGIVVAIQIFLLPIFHGMLYADRKVRVLETIPNSIQGLKEPLGIVDRTSEHVALLGLNESNRRNIVTIKIDDLNGIPIKSIVSLKQFVAALEEEEKRKVNSVMSEREQSNNSTASSDSDEKKGFFEILANYLQITFESIGSLGHSEIDKGQIWMVKLDDSGEAPKSNQIGSKSNFSWPVFAPDARTIYAVQNQKLVKLSSEGQNLTVVDDQMRWSKLLGVNENGEILGMVQETSESIPAIARTDGNVTLGAIAKSDEEKKRNLVLMHESRSYSGSRSLYVDRPEKGGRGFDVFFRNGHNVVNLSNCGDDSCGQPSITPDFKNALYIRKSRY